MTKQKNRFALDPGADPSDRIGFFRTCSDAMLQQFELARLSSAANYAKQLNEIIRRAAEELADARVARIVRENRKTLMKAPASTPAMEIMADLVPMLPEPEPKRPRLPKAKK
jgi:hypothetical protein